MSLVPGRRTAWTPASNGGGKPPGAIVSDAEAVLFTGVRVFDGDRFLNGPIDVAVALGTILGIGQGLGLTGSTEVATIEGGVLFPGFVDAHVHLSMSDPWDVAEGGVTAVLDLGSPIAYAFAEHPPLRFAAAGPLITTRRGYPTTSWGANGFGLEVDGVEQARDAVSLLADGGAAMIKVAIEPRGGPVLDPRTLRGAVDATHQRGLKVAAHALDAASVRLALDSGVDVLAHTPVERLPGDLVTALGAARVQVVSTVRAFGDRRDARTNLAALADAGCVIAYGTDLGNGSIRPGIDPGELGILDKALGGPERALAAATSVSGALAGSPGRIVAEARADLLWVPRFDSYDDLRRGARVFLGSA